MTQRQYTETPMMATTPTAPFLTLLPQRAASPSASLPLLFRDADGNADPSAAYGVSTRGLDADMCAARAESARLIEGGYLAGDARTRRMVWWLRRMGYDDALVFNEWRVELLYLDSGQPHFRVYWRGYTFGVVGIAATHADLGASRNLEAVRGLLAAYLVGWGWDVNGLRLVRGGALTPLTANTDHQHRLFEIRTKRKTSREYDMLREEE